MARGGSKKVLICIRLVQEPGRELCRCAAVVNNFLQRHLLDARCIPAHTTCSGQGTKSIVQTAKEILLCINGALITAVPA